MRLGDIEKRLDQQFETDVRVLKANYARQNKLLPIVTEFRDLEREAKDREDRMRRIIELMGEEQFQDRDELRRSGDDVSQMVAVTTYKDSPLWEAIRTVLEQVQELQVVDLQEVLAHFKRRASRQAIESALASHKETFETRTRGREKFVSLKR